MLKDKVVLVTGAGTGIGAAAARAVVQEGGKVVMVGRRAAALDAGASHCGRRGIDCRYEPGRR
jgi:NADP-dependent 3-hydroxy acid dehydrogenase YdfG